MAALGRLIRAIVHVINHEPLTSLGNQLLNGLPEQLKTLLMDKCSKTQKDFGQVMCLTEQPTSEVYFPLSGFISQVAGLDNQKPLEVGMIGSEGMLAAPFGTRHKNSTVQFYCARAGGIINYPNQHIYIDGSAIFLACQFVTSLCFYEAHPIETS